MKITYDLPPMPIPDFDLDGVIPPHVGDPRHAANCSPYVCSALEVVERFSFNRARCEILEGWLRLREIMQTEGFSGLQWINGSFTEDKEGRIGKNPGDIDVVTYYVEPTATFNADFVARHPTFANRAAVKLAYHVDHIPIALNRFPLDAGIKLIAFWAGLFGHRKADGARKGLLTVQLGDLADDLAARHHLTTVLSSLP